MRRPHDPARLRLPEHVPQLHRGYRPGGDDIAEHAAGPDARELIRVADKDDLRIRLDGVEKRGAQRQVQHRRLVHHDDVRVERRGPVPGERALVRQRGRLVVGGFVVRIAAAFAPFPGLQKPVDGATLHGLRHATPRGRDLREPLRGSTRGRAHQHLAAHRAPQPNRDVRRERLTSPGSAG